MASDKDRDKVEFSPDELYEKLNLETGKISWEELQRHFARGVVVAVDPGLDLVQVALSFSQDDKSQVEAWIDAGKITRANDDHARRWTEKKPDFWAVVSAPWVLVQEMTLQ